MPKVLIVDDNADERLIFATLLEHHGYAVVTADDGPTAVTAARQHVPHVILMDVNLPGMSGLTATELIRTMPETADIPVICVTSFDVTIEEARRSGCQRLLRKPIAPAHLISTVDTIIRPLGPKA